MALTQTDKKISQLTPLPSGTTLTGVKTVVVKDDANGFPHSYSADLTFLQTAADNANTKAGLANTAATNANEKATLAQAKIDVMDSDHTRAEADHTTASSDHTTAGNDHTQATQDHQAIAPTIATVAELSEAMPTKASKASSPTAGHIATLDASGNPTDSGKTVGDVTDIIYGYLYQGAFYEDSAHQTAITPITTKQYVDMSVAAQPIPYMWNGSIYVKIGGTDMEEYTVAEVEALCDQYFV